MKAQRLAVIMGILLLSSAVAQAMTGDLFLRTVDGEVLLKPKDSADWVPASINTPLEPGDQVWASNEGQGEVFTRQGSRIDLLNNTLLEIVASEAETTEFGIAAGEIRVTGAIPRNGAVLVYSPVVSVSAGAGSAFRTAVSENGDTEIAVYNGEVALEDENGRQRLTSGQRVVVKAASDGADAVTPVAGQDRPWPESAPEGYAPSRSPYLPDELSAYSPDLDSNGRWVNTVDYGYAWVPRVASSYGWSPYRIGRWVWMGGNYLWISYEPWGWAPYHYGRWAFANGTGWCWVPPRRGSVFWGPGYVGWVHTPTHLAWVPLAPTETYYGYGYYGPHSVNIVNVTMNRVVIPRHFKHIHAQNAVVTVHRDEFLHGRKVPGNPMNLFLNEGASAGPPSIKPVRATTMPVVREIQAAKLPPARLAEANGRNMKRIHPVVPQQASRNVPWGAPAGLTKTPAVTVISNQARTNPGPAKKAAFPAVSKDAPAKAGPKPVTAAAAPFQTQPKRLEIPEAQRRKQEAASPQRSFEPKPTVVTLRKTERITPVASQSPKPMVEARNPPSTRVAEPKNRISSAQPVAARPQAAERKARVVEEKVPVEHTGNDPRETPKPVVPIQARRQIQADGHAAAPMSVAGARAAVR